MTDCFEIRSVARSRVPIKISGLNSKYGMYQVFAQQVTYLITLTYKQASLTSHIDGIPVSFVKCHFQYIAVSMW